MGFKGSRKSTPFVAQLAAEDAEKSGGAWNEGADVQVRGPGSGANQLRALQSVGFNVTSIMT